MRILTSAVILAAAMAVAASGVRAGHRVQQFHAEAGRRSPPPAKPPAPKPKVGSRGFFVLDTEMMTASKSFDAVTGSSTLIGYGGGGEVVNLWQNLFVRGSIAVAPTSGERAFVVNGRS